MQTVSESPKRADGWLPTRESLLNRLKDWGDDESWNAFFETYWHLIYRAAIKSGLTEAEAQDAVQETIFQVSKCMKTFEYQQHGSFKQWLLQQTRWRIADQFRKRQKDIEPPSNRKQPEQTATIDRV